MREQLPAEYFKLSLETLGLEQERSERQQYGA